MKPPKKIPGLSQDDALRVEHYMKKLQRELEVLKAEWQKTHQYKAYEKVKAEYSAFIKRLADEGQDLNHLDKGLGEKLDHLSHRLDAATSKLYEPKEHTRMMEKKNAVATFQQVLNNAEDKENLRQYLERLDAKALNAQGIFRSGRDLLKDLRHKVEGQTAVVLGPSTQQKPGK